MKSQDAEDNYGIKLSNEQYRKFDEVYGDENSATIREHKHIKEPLKGDQLTQYRDNIQIVSYNRKSKNKKKPLILEKDGNRYRPNKLVYTFATPEGVKANLKWIRTEIKENDEFLSVEIINSKGEKKIIDIDNLNLLDSPGLSKWLGSSSVNKSRNQT